MSAKNSTENENNAAVNEWTVMFFFAGDNSLSPLIVSQIKAIKDAGFHKKVEVLVHFDSNEVGVPTRLFNVNRERKSKSERDFMVGDDGNSFVRNMKEDNILPEEIDDELGPESSLSSGLRLEDSATSLRALKDFINFCAKKHKAKNYILFLVGHGLVVGHDAFLPDDHPLSAIKLTDMRDTLDVFNAQIRGHGGTLQLLALHSCAMSAVEVAYELKGLAKYMMSSEGISYICSWPYRQLLMKLITTVAMSQGASAVLPYGEDIQAPQTTGTENGPELATQQLINSLFFLSFFNAKDYEISGYSLDLALCNLDVGNFESLTEKVRALVRLMRDALYDRESPRGKIIKELILLAHWESQSYWDENYTDLYDFCRCLKNRCDMLDGMIKANVGDLTTLSKACSDVTDQLSEKGEGDFAKRFNGLVVCSTHSGPLYQYSHGLSVYFPWSRPVDDDPQFSLSAQEIIDRYATYKFNTEMGNDSWVSFLKAYFLMTMRKKRTVEDGKEPDVAPRFELEAASSGVMTAVGMAASLASDKPTPSTGRPCTCTSIKNYPTAMVVVGGKNRYVKTS